jgi:hypothetical protein
LRTLILVVFTCFVLTLGFLGYWWMQPNRPPKSPGSGKDSAALPLQPPEADKNYGPGQNVWIKKFNPDSAKLASRFKADSYKPRNDGWIVVQEPRAQFFMNDGRAILVEGKSGEIIMDDNKTGMNALAGSRDTPSRGRLYDVTIRLYHDIDDPEVQMDEDYLNGNDEDRPMPAMTITLNNASFDNQTFKIYSEAFGRGKGHVAADMVPVKLRGDDYDFDGKGLIIRWNERDRRLQLLEVAHGETLTIKHPSNVMKKEEPAVALEGPLPAMLAAAKGRAGTADAIGAAKTPPPVAGAATRRVRPNVPRPRIVPNTDPPLYRAIFHDNVKIVQGEEMSVLGNKMSVDFLMQDQESDKPEKAAKPAPAPVPGKAGRTTGTRPTTQMALSPATQPSTHVESQPATRMAMAPATQPASSTQPTARRERKPVDENEKPVIITWTGKLVVEPLSVGTETPMKNGDAVIRIDGTPVVATQQGSTIYSGTLTYRTEDQAMLLTPMGPTRPVVLKDTKGSVVETTRLDFFQPKHQAILYGASNALFPQEDESGKPGPPLLAKWTKTCTLYFAGGELASAGGSMNIERAELEGNVDVNHPQIKIKSDALELTFDTSKSGSTTKPTTRSTTNPATLPAPFDATPVPAADARLLALKASLLEMDNRMAQLSAPFATANPDAVVQAKMLNLLKVENTLASQNKAIKDRIETAQSTPKSMLDQVEQTKQQYGASKTEFDRLQQSAVAIQELRGERTKLARQVADAQKQFNATTRSTQMAGATSRPTTQATTRPAMRTDLKQLVATGVVHCEMTDATKKTQTIDCNRLTLQTAATPDGKIYPKTVNADGEVHAVDPDQDLRAGHLAVVLRPSTQPSKTAAGGNTANAELQSMIAHQDVKVVSKDGTITTSDQLLVESKDGKNNIKLLGGPARIVDKKSILTGPIIEIFPDAQQLQVVGGGNMKGVQQEKPGDPERPIDVTWLRGMTFDGKTNVVDVTGQVVAVTQDSDGAVNTARGDRVKMLLADATPTTRPTTRSTTQASTQPGGEQVAVTQPVTRPTELAMATTTQPTSRPTTKPSRSGDYGGMASKNVRHISFEDDAKIDSVTMADDGSLLRRTHLESAIVQYDLLEKKLLVPQEGRMIVEDHRPTTQPATQPAGGGLADARPASAKADSSAENNRGTSAFQWFKQFTYDDSAHQAIMLGDEHNQVVVVHRDDSPKAQSYRLTGDSVTADLEDIATTQPTTKAVASATMPSTTQATTKPADRLSKVQLKRVTALGHLLFTGPNAEIHANYMEYDPRTHWLIARGSERDLVTFEIGAHPIGSKRAEEIQYNLDTGEIRGARAELHMGR